MATSRERVLTAFAFERPDRIPRFDSFFKDFQGFPAAWADSLGPVEDLSDISIWVPREGTFCTRERRLREEDGQIYRIDEWGRTIRTVPGAFFVETLEVPIPAGTDPDSVEFDSADLDARYIGAGSGAETGAGGESEAATLAQLAQDKQTYCIFGKTGGPYLRTTFVRGEEQFLLDIAGDPPLARALVDKMADHLIAMALQQLKRWSLQDTGVWIYDDMAYNHGPMFSPASFEEVFLPAYRRMIAAYKAAGATYVLLHSDGNIMPILDMLVDAGIDGLNPLEQRAGMDVAAIHARHPHLILTGGMCNTDTLVNGPVERIENEARELIDLGRNGGVVIGTHSISPEIPLEHFLAYDRTCRTYGDFSIDSE